MQFDWTASRVVDQLKRWAGCRSSAQDLARAEPFLEKLEQG
jgi:hypothetical protein